MKWNGKINATRVVPTESVKAEYTYIDSLKGIAICGIIMTHSEGGRLPSIFGNIGYIGKNGVQLFFLISALLTYMSMEHSFADGNITFRKILSWWKKKLVRLMPVYYLSLIIYAVVLGWGSDGYWLGSDGKIEALNILAHIFFLHGLFPRYANCVGSGEWYLGTLVVFYFLAPFIYRKINTFEKSVIAFLTMSLASTLMSHIACILFKEVEDAYLYDSYFGTLWIFAQLPVMLLGIVLYFIFKDGFLEEIKNKAAFSYTILLFSIAMICGQALGKNTILGLKEYTLFGVWFFMIVVSQKIHRCLLIDNAFFRIMGKYSYPIYLFHNLIISLYSSRINISVGFFPIDWSIKFIIVTLSSLIMAIPLTFVDRKLNRLFFRNP